MFVLWIFSNILASLATSCQNRIKSRISPTFIRLGTQRLSQINRKKLCWDTFCCHFWLHCFCPRRPLCVGVSLCAGLRQLFPTQPQRQWTGWREVTQVNWCLYRRLHNKSKWTWFQSRTPQLRRGNILGLKTVATKRSNTSVTCYVPNVWYLFKASVCKI